MEGGGYPTRAQGAWSGGSVRTRAAQKGKGGGRACYTGAEGQDGGVDVARVEHAGHVQQLRGVASVTSVA